MRLPNLQIRRSVEIDSGEIPQPRKGPHEGARVERTSINQGRYYRPVCFCGWSLPATMNQNNAQQAVDQHKEEATVAPDDTRRRVRKARRAQGTAP